MVATFTVEEDNSGTSGNPVSTDLLGGGRDPNQQHRTDVTSLVDTDNPIAIQDTGNSYGYTKPTILVCTFAPSLQVDNVQFFTSTSTLPAGVDVVVQDQQIVRTLADKTNYVLAQGTVGDSGDEMTTFFTGATTVTSVFTFTSGSPLAVTISEAGNIIDAVGETTDYLVFQMVVADTTAPAVTNNQFGTYQYDEI